MKTKTTLQWTESYLKSLSTLEDQSWQTITAITDLLKFHASILPESAEERLSQLEKKVSNLEADAMLGKFGGKR